MMSKKIHKHCCKRGLVSQEVGFDWDFCFKRGLVSQEVGFHRQFHCTVIVPCVSRQAGDQEG